MLNGTCYKCDNKIAAKRVELGYRTCLQCGEVEAKRRKFTVVPMHKSNYMVVTDLSLLTGINNKQRSG